MFNRYKIEEYETNKKLYRLSMSLFFKSRIAARNRNEKNIITNMVSLISILSSFIFNGFIEKSSIIILKLAKL